MPQIKLKISGPIFEGDAAKLLIRSAIKEALEFGKGVIKEATPVRTGNLQRNWFYRTAEGAIYNEVPYCSYVEDGTSRMTARGMAKNSVPEIADYLAEALERQLEQLE